MIRRGQSWQEELTIIDRVMREISSVTDPEKMVEVYWRGIGELVDIEEYVALSRRGVDPPWYLVTRSSRFTEHFNPWTQRDRLPKLKGGLLGEIAYADKPVVIDDLPKRLAPDDPGRQYLEGCQSLIALPQYDNGQSLNIGISLYKEGIELDMSAVPMMHWQSGLFGRGTQNLVLRNQLTAALGELDRELRVVAEIQRSLLPAELPAIPGFELATFYETSARAGGDYYDFFPLDDECWGIFIADVSGHGTPAAVLMAITHAIAHTRPGQPRPPGELLAHINHHLARTYTTSGTFVTAFYATLDPRNRTITYSSAGHNPPRLLRGRGRDNARVLSLDRRGGLPLGIVSDERYEEATVTLEPGDVLLLYTDGITETMSPPDASGGRELFGTRRLDELLLAEGGVLANAAAHLERIRVALAEFSGSDKSGAPPRDDQTAIALRCEG